MPNANIDLVTAHTEQPHITTQNVVDLIGGLSGVTDKVRRLKTPSTGLQLTYSGMTFTISAGSGIAGGYFFELGDNYSVTLDSGRNGYTRKDGIFIVIYEDPQTNIQSCDFVYVAGIEVSNGSNAASPNAPTGANISKTFIFAEITVKNNAVFSVVNSVIAYDDNAALSHQADGLQQSVNYLQSQINEMKQSFTDDLQSQINEMKQSFTDGCNAIATALINKGVTPTKGENTQNYTPNDFISAIDALLAKRKRTVSYKVSSNTVETSRDANYKYTKTTVTVIVGGTTKTFTGTGSVPLSGLGGGSGTNVTGSWTQNI